MKGARVHACLAGHPPEKSGSLVRAHYFYRRSRDARRRRARHSAEGPVPNPHPPTGNEGCALIVLGSTSYQLGAEPRLDRLPCRACRSSSETPLAAVTGPRSGSVVDGDRIVEADAPGLERELAGLTLLEAAAVGGETLAVDALANALGPVFRARRVADARRRRDERRRRQRGRAPPLAAGRGRRDAAALARSRRGRTPSAPAARPTA